MSNATAIAERDESNVVRTDASSLMEVISRAASDPSTDVDKLERLLGMYERITGREAEQAYNAAMNAAQTEMRPISQDASNPQTRSKYASYAALDGRMRPIYSKHGFSVRFDTADGAPEGWVRVVSKVSHIGGHSDITHIDIPADGKGAKGGDVMTKTHATVSAVSYGKRTLLKMNFNIAEGGNVDDDGNAAGNEPIDAKQVAFLQSKIVETGTDLTRFLKFMRVSRLEDLKLSQFGVAVMRIEEVAKIKERAEASDNAGH